MEAMKAKITKGLCHGSEIETCDNSGAKVVRIISVINRKTRKGQTLSPPPLLFRLKIT